MATPGGAQPPGQSEDAATGGAKATAQAAPAADTQTQDSPQTQENGASPNEPKSTEDKQLERNRSLVRVLVTYMAAGFLFIVGAALVGYFVAVNKDDDGKDLFLAILPVAAAIVTYWFATRKNEALKSSDLVDIIKAARDK